MSSAARTAIPKKLERLLYQEVGSRCPICGNSDIGVLTVHHIVPYATTNTHNADAMIVLCSNCHSLADSQRITIDELFDKKRHLASEQKSAACTPTHKNGSVIGVIAAGRDVNISGTVTIKQSGTSNKEPQVRPGTVSEDKWMIGYLEHLVSRYNEFKKLEAAKTGARLDYSRIRRDFEREIGFLVRHTPVELFAKAVLFLQRRIDRHTILGRSHVNNGAPNYSPFQDWKAKQLG